MLSDQRIGSTLVANPSQGVLFQELWSKTRLRYCTSKRYTYKTTICICYVRMSEISRIVVAELTLAE